MLFPSEVFLFLFLPFVLAVYYLVLRKHTVGKNIFLFIMSLLFYAYGEPKYVFLMLFMILLHYGLGLLINKYSDDKRMQKLILFLMVVIDVCILGYFKYLNFIVSIFTGKVSIPWWRSHPIHENRATESIWTEPCNPLLRATKSTKRATSTY